MEKTVSVYKLSLMEKKCVSEGDSIPYMVPSVNQDLFRFNQNTEVQEVKIHMICAREAVSAHRENNLGPESIFRKQAEDVGKGKREIIGDDHLGYAVPTKIYQTTSYAGFFFTEDVPLFLRRTFDPTYVQKIETENREYKRDLRIASEDFKMLIVKLAGTKLILDGPITGFIRYRLQGWWKKIKEKIKHEHKRKQTNG